MSESYLREDLVIGSIPISLRHFQVDGRDKRLEIIVRPDSENEQKFIIDSYDLHKIRELLTR